MLTHAKLLEKYPWITGHINHLAAICADSSITVTKLDDRVTLVLSRDTNPQNNRYGDRGYYTGVIYRRAIDPNKEYASYWQLRVQRDPYVCGKVTLGCYAMSINAEWPNLDHHLVQLVEGLCKLAYDSAYGLIDTVMPVNRDMTRVSYPALMEALLRSGFKSSGMVSRNPNSGNNLMQLSKGLSTEHQFKGELIVKPLIPLSKPKEEKPASQPKSRSLGDNVSYSLAV